MHQNALLLCPDVAWLCSCSAEEQRRKQQASMAPVHVVAAPDFTEKVKKLKERLRENCKVCCD